MQEPTAEGPGAWARAVAAPLVRAGRELVGVGLGVLTALLTLAWAVAATAALALSPLAPRTRHRITAILSRWARRLCDADLARLARWCDCPVRPRAETGPRVAYLLLRIPVALLCGCLAPTAVLLVGVFLGGAALEAATGTGTTVPVPMPGAQMHISSISVGLFMGVGTLAATALAAAAAAASDRALARRLVGPSREDLLARRIDELTLTRAEVVQAVDEERRRIERDLHDGVQQRVVALAMLLGRARRGSDPRRAARLVDEAHAETRVLLDELREVAWQVYPAALDTSGLEAALTEVAQRSPLPVEVRVRLSAPPPRAQAAAVYFTAREAITNAVKHARAGSVVVHLDDLGHGLELRGLDDGRGGADPDGGGLTGLGRRIRALDGTLSVDSPEGGPTTVRAVLPLP